MLVWAREAWANKSTRDKSALEWWQPRPRLAQVAAPLVSKACGHKTTQTQLTHLQALLHAKDKGNGEEMTKGALAQHLPCSPVAPHACTRARTHAPSAHSPARSPTRPPTHPLSRPPAHTHRLACTCARTHRSLPTSTRARAHRCRHKQEERRRSAAFPHSAHIDIRM